MGKGGMGGKGGKKTKKYSQTASSTDVFIPPFPFVLLLMSHSWAETESSIPTRIQVSLQPYTRDPSAKFDVVNDSDMYSGHVSQTACGRYGGPAYHQRFVITFVC
jgi:hypothetical protein